MSRSFRLPFGVPVIESARRFLARNGHAAADVERLHSAWAKSVTLTLVLWSRPYVTNRLW